MGKSLVLLCFLIYKTRKQCLTCFRDVKFQWQSRYECDLNTVIYIFFISINFQDHQISDGSGWWRTQVVGNRGMVIKCAMLLKGLKTQAQIRQTQVQVLRLTFIVYDLGQNFLSLLSSSFIIYKLGMVILHGDVMWFKWDQYKEFWQAHGGLCINSCHWL